MKHPILILFMAFINFAVLQAQQPPYLDTLLSFEERVDDLVSRMTLEEKISQMLYDAPAIDRLGIPVYNWWNESLHGVARSGLATVFPQAIGLAASWDRELMLRIATAISDEARAKYHEYQRRGEHNIYQGLTFWSPNINIFRDPRWGRGMETYGEDPFLTGTLAVQFIKGMQGEHPKYLKTVATSKHFAVHSGPEHVRHEFNAMVDNIDLYGTYLPAFEMTIRQANVQSIMCAYNRLQGEPCCGSSPLLGNILRERWGFKGYVVSDCWAIMDFYTFHKVVATQEEAAAMALMAGTDLNCGVSYRSLTEAIKLGLVMESDVDHSIKRLFLARMRLGMFDPPGQNPYSLIPISRLDNDDHRTLALEAARKSIVLLKNDNHLLPLSKEIRKIAVIGPNADDQEVMLGNYNGIPSAIITPIQGIRDKVPLAEVTYMQGCRHAESHTTSGSPENSAAILSAAADAEVVILCLGLSPRLEGEDLKIELEGFNGGDRTRLDLPKVQQALLEQITGLGKPVVLVLLNGSALAINWAQDHVPAIIEAWYPGQSGGTAIADVLFGDYNPSGRLPVTFYRSLAQLPAFEDYSMQGRTYRYFEGDPLYPFGFGLSFTSFEYTRITPDHGTIEAGDTLEITISLKNTGKISGEEVVQVYVDYPQAPFRVPLVELKDYKRVWLESGEEKEIRFAIFSDQLKVPDESGEFVLIPGTCQVIAGGCSPGPRSLKLGVAAPVKAAFIIKPE